MGFFDVLLGRSKLKKAQSDRLFALVTAEITLATELDLHHKKAAGVVFKSLDTGDFYQIMNDVEELLASAKSETGTKVERKTDSYGYSWLVFRDADFSDLVTTLNMVSESLAAGGYSEQLLCAVFPFKTRKGETIYWIYNYKRGSFYPFVPHEDDKEKRDGEEEFRLQAAVGNELPIEQDTGYWYPLWGMPV